MTLQLIDKATRYLFFTGKGGVGKTSLSCATAVALADRGRRVLLVSTDPASNLDEVLGIQVAGQPTAVSHVLGLFALNITPEGAARELRERVIGPYRGVLPEQAVRQMEEQMSGACTIEVAAFDEFAKLLGDVHTVEGYDHVIFDTAPTGHTLRLLRLPAAWDGFLRSNTTGTSCISPLSGLGAQQALYAAAVETLSDGNRTTLVLVTRPEQSAIAEAERTSRELAALGLSNQRLVVNGVFEARDDADELALAYEKRGREALAILPLALRAVPTERVPLVGHDLVGIEALRALLSPDHQPLYGAAPPSLSLSEVSSLGGLVDELAAGHGLILVMGKGGVGKTTVAAAIASELARRRLPVHLTTTDPAAHLGFALGGEVTGLRVSRIDPEAETRAYVEHVLATSGAGLDAQGRALLEEDLRSPCTEEVAVFQAFSRTIAEARHSFVVLDTAPTGHTLLLLDATGSYHRDVMRNAGKFPGRVTTPLMRLQDPSFTRILIITLPETTPVLEAERLQDDLRRAGIEPYAWVLNRSLAAAGVRDPILARRAAAELPHVRRVSEELSTRLAIVPWLAQEPVGTDGLGRLLESAHSRVPRTTAFPIGPVDSAQ